MKEVFVKKYWDEEDVLFYLHFQDNEVVRQLEITSTSKLNITLNNPIKDADEFGDFIINKHKGSAGTFIPWKHLSTVK
ncbi:hypothetical protein [Chryseobacterium profundimaris]|uniref:DUF2283 domain-containing protein n=1 Tax=Chryseobacterium profundimaris TaxID=1387275 RepID=A0ABY1P8Y7_9FLAO|nr:hypothetical protein [Chryseobacterium profundimaris]SMP29191.1 hypothetical protein SAMN06264346_11183 [Chryseobacterium profundimaris]